MLCINVAKNIILNFKENLLRKKFKKKTMSVALSASVVFGGISICNLCTRSICSTITEEQKIELVEKIKQQDFYNILNGKSGREHKKKLVKLPDSWVMNR